MSSEITLGPIVPILRIFDIAKAREFYADFLGFTWDWEHRFDDSAPLLRRFRAPASCSISANITAMARQGHT